VVHALGDVATSLTNSKQLSLFDYLLKLCSKFGYI